MYTLAAFPFNIAIIGWVLIVSAKYNVIVALVIFILGMDDIRAFVNVMMSAL